MQVTADQLFDAAWQAIREEPRLDDICERLSDRDLRKLISVVISATATIAAEQVLTAMRQVANTELPL